jgi:hypothetical protein
MLHSISGLCIWANMPRYVSLQGMKVGPGRRGEAAVANQARRSERPSVSGEGE